MKTATRIPRKSHLLTCILFSACLFYLGCSKDDPADAQPKAFGELHGTVKSTDGTAYANVEVELQATGSGVQHTDVTDASGNYQMSPVPAGNYTLHAERPLGSTVNNNGTAVSITDGQSIRKDINFDIETIEGYVAYAPVDPLGEVMNENGEVPTGNEPLYTPFSVSDPQAGPLSAIMAPDNHHITLNEWRSASGMAMVSCDGGTTRYMLEFSGLIPNGVYTLWNGITKAPTKPENRLSFENSFEGIGALKDGDSNIVVASAQGEAQIQLSVDPGTLSMFGTQPPCAITGTRGFIIVLDYHIDGMTHGPTPGKDYTEVAHLLFFF